MKFSRAALAVGFLLSTFTLTAHADIKDPETGQTFSSSQTVWGKSWIAIGAGAREKFTINVYATALYIEKERGAAALQKWLSGDGASYASGGKVDVSKAVGTQKFFNVLLNCGCGRGIEIKLVRAVNGPEIMEAFMGSLEKSMGDLTAADVADDVKKLKAFLNYDVKKGSQFKFYFSAGGSLAATGPGGEVKIKNKKIARGLLGVWIGRSPIQKNLKKQLVSNVNALLD